MVGRLRVVAHELIQLLVGLALHPGTDFASAELVQRRLVDNLARDADRIAELMPVLLARHIVEQDSGMAARIARLNAHMAAARRSHRADVTLETVRVDRVRPVVVNRHRQEVILNIRPGKLFTAADKAARFEVVAGADAGAVEHPLRADFRLVPPLQRRVERHRLFALVLQIHLQVILKVLADAGQIVHHGNIERLQQAGRADAGALQNLRRSDGARAEQHLASRMRLVRGIARAQQILHANGALAVEQDAIGGRMGNDFQVRAVFRLVKVAACGAGAAPLRRHGTIHRAEALLLIAVEILGARIARLDARVDHRGE